MLVGAAMPDNGAQFLRAADPGSQFAQVLQMLAREGIVAPWRGRFGMLGARAGSFLPAEAISGAGMMRGNEDGGGDSYPLGACELARGEVITLAWVLHPYCSSRVLSCPQTTFVGL